MVVYLVGLLRIVKTLPWCTWALCKESLIDSARLLLYALYMRKDNNIGLSCICWIMVLDNPAACVRARCVEHKPHVFQLYFATKLSLILHLPIRSQNSRPCKA